MYDVIEYGKNIKNFRGCFMRNELPKFPKNNECGILNLEDSNHFGSHWVCWFKKENFQFYFDSYGDAKPPRELVDYLSNNKILYNKDRIQDFNDPPICGHLCLLLLHDLSKIFFITK